MGAELYILISMLYQFAILNFVKRYIKAIRSYPFQLLACFMGSLITVFSLPTFLSFSISYLVFITIAFPRHVFMKAFFTCFAVGCFLGGVILGVAEFWPQQMQNQVLFFIILSGVTLLILANHLKKIKLHSIQERFIQSYTIEIAQIQWNLTGYIDTGNECEEILSGAPVNFIQMKSIQQELPFRIKEGLEKWDKKTPYNLQMFDQRDHKNIRFVTVQTISNTQQIALAFRGKIIISSQQFEDCYFVFVQDVQAFPGHAQMLLHVSMLSNLQTKGG